MLTADESATIPEQISCNFLFTLHSARMRHHRNMTGVRLLTALLCLPFLPLTTFAQARDTVNNPRSLYVFTPSGNDPRSIEQARAIRTNQADADERQLVLMPEINGAAYENSEQAGLRRRFKIKPGDFTVILVGKDGGEKLRSGKPISFDKLRDTIDSMPMRQQEMKN
jgi:hypothetical protein